MRRDAIALTAALLLVATAAAQSQDKQSGADGSLSRRLDRSGGIIKPPPTTDRDVIAPPNEAQSNMPVIPPPGTAGNNPRLQPK